MEQRCGPHQYLSYQCGSGCAWWLPVCRRRAGWGFMPQHCRKVSARMSISTLHHFPVLHHLLTNWPSSIRNIFFWSRTLKNTRPTTTATAKNNNNNNKKHKNYVKPIETIWCKILNTHLVQREINVSRKKQILIFYDSWQQFLWQQWM